MTLTGAGPRLNAVAQKASKSYRNDIGRVAEWFKAKVLTKSATADLGREPAGQAGERSEHSEDEKHALSMFFAKPAVPKASFGIAVYGWVAEWFKAAVLKTAVAETLP